MKSCLQNLLAQVNDSETRKTGPLHRPHMYCEGWGGGGALVRQVQLCLWNYDDPCNTFPTLRFDVAVDSFFLARTRAHARARARNALVRTDYSSEEGGGVGWGLGGGGQFPGVESWAGRGARGGESGSEPPTVRWRPSGGTSMTKAAKGRQAGQDLSMTKAANGRQAGQDKKGRQAAQDSPKGSFYPGPRAGQHPSKGSTALGLGQNRQLRPAGGRATGADDSSAVARVGLGGAGRPAAGGDEVARCGCVRVWADGGGAELLCGLLLGRHALLRLARRRGLQEPAVACRLLVRPERGRGAEGEGEGEGEGEREWEGGREEGREGGREERREGGEGVGRKVGSCGEGGGRGREIDK